MEFFFYSARAFVHLKKGRHCSVRHVEAACLRFVVVSFQKEKYL
jgi:hypothetical protein